MAVEALAQREDCSVERIGAWKRGYRVRDGHAQSIAIWAEQQGIEAVVWTSLGPRFAGTAGRIPTAGEAVDYLRGLAGDTRKKAEEHVRRAPQQIRTPYRKRFEQELGWTEIAKHA
jgi:hypothetical protein